MKKSGMMLLAMALGASMLACGVKQKGGKEEVVVKRVSDDGRVRIHISNKSKPAGGATCAEREQRMNAINDYAQTLYMQTVSRGLGGGGIPTGNTAQLRADQADFLATYGGIRCDGMTNESWSDQISRYIQQIEQAQF